MGEKAKRILQGFFLIVLSYAAIKIGLNYNSLDGLSAAVFVALFGHDTEYSQDYSDARFRELSVGMRVPQVEKIMKRPPVISVGFNSIKCAKYISFYSEAHASGWRILTMDLEKKSCAKQEFAKYAALNYEELIKQLGAPVNMLWSFSWPKSPEMPFRLRSIGFDNGVVTKKSSYLYDD